jgi:tetratricopeptide (TPR) repeat protein
MQHRIYLNLSILYRITGDNYNAICYINKAADYFKSTGNTQKYINVITEKIITLFTFHCGSDLIRDLINTTIHHPQIREIEKGELYSILGTLELRDKNYDPALKLLLLAQELICDNVNSEMNIFIYKGLHEICQYMQDHANTMLYKAKIDALLEQKPYYR